MTIREQALKAHRDAEAQQAYWRKVKQEEFEHKASNKLNAVLCIIEQRTWVWQRRYVQHMPATVLVLDGIRIKADRDDGDIVLMAYVWTNDDGMAWCSFSSLADLGALLQEDADKPIDRQQSGKLCDVAECFESAYEAGEYCETHRLQAISTER